METSTELSTLGAVVVHFHREADASRLVADLVGRVGLRAEHVVLVDNGSEPDRLSAELATHDVRPHVVRLPNPGYAAAVNAGVAALPDGVDTVLLLTHEVRLGRDCVTALREELETPGVGLVGPLLLEADDRVWSAGGLLDGVRRLPAHRHHGTAPADVPAHPVESAWLDGAVLMLRRGELAGLGGLDDRYHLYAEDVDLGLRMAKAGRRVLMVPRATAFQQPGGDIDPYLWTRNTFLLFRAHGLRVAWALWLASVVVGIGRDLLTGRARTAEVGRRVAGLRAGLANHDGPPPVRVAWPRTSGTEGGGP